jgi:hypothetical protein
MSRQASWTISSRSITRTFELSEALTSFFARGAADKAPGCVHVFDDASLTTLLGELSTIKDFIHYLDSKVALTETANLKFADAETDLLARCLWHGRTFPAENGPCRTEPNLWKEVEASEQFLAGRARGTCARSTSRSRDAADTIFPHARCG